MADDKSLHDGRPRSALTDAAVRFDTLARNLRDRQFAQMHEPDAGQVGREIVSPDEEWAKKFMTQSIGPSPEVPPIRAFMPPPMPVISLEPVVPPSQRLEQRRPEPAAPIGRRLGKPEPRRSWLSRLLRSR